MNYWQRILHEVMELERNGFPFRFTNISETQCRETTLKLKRHRVPRKSKTLVYEVGGVFENCFFTQREVECLLLLLEDRTIVQTAQLMNLSPRTVEFYVKKMRMKTHVANKNELLKTIVKTDLLKNINFTANDVRKMISTTQSPRC